ncbi:hypothetical protein [Pseudomonas sp. CES]|uniref:hypothetical protein n=1 Tax=Pseudomonas sp. CES TaxID=2719586 RepID=UPI0017DBF933|nr:hypothetical protein HBJ16_005254 [Pseudomonas sp. CES]
MLSIRNPETNEVIDRVFFTYDLYKGEAYWAIARLFMQQGPEAHALPGTQGSLAGGH